MIVTANDFATIKRLIFLPTVDTWSPQVEKSSPNSAFAPTTDVAD